MYQCFIVWLIVGFRMFILNSPTKCHLFLFSKPYYHQYRSLGPITQNSQSVKNNLYPKLHFKYVLTRGLVAYGIAVESRKKSASDRKQWKCAVQTEKYFAQQFIWKITTAAPFVGHGDNLYIDGAPYLNIFYCSDSTQIASSGRVPRCFSEDLISHQKRWWWQATSLFVR